MNLKNEIQAAEFVLEQYEKDQVHAARMAGCLSRLIAACKSVVSEDENDTGNNNRECGKDRC